jgi:hypothetical protein
VSTSSTVPYPIETPSIRKNEENAVPSILRPIYKGHMNNAVKMLKVFSVSSLGLSVIGFPISYSLIESSFVTSNEILALMLSPSFMAGSMYRYRFKV